MKNLTVALLTSIRDLFRPQILLLMFMPPILALIFWGAMAFFAWPYLMGMAIWMMSWAPEFLQSTTGAIAVLLAIGMILPLALLSVLLFTSVFAMPLIVPQVAKNYFPDLESNSKGTFQAGLNNVFWTSIKYLFFWFLTMPLWFVPGLNIAVPLVLNAYLNYKLFIYDALGGHGSPSEIRELIQSKRAEFYILGLITAVLMVTPIIFLIAPFYTALSFTHMALAELRDYRKEKPRTGFLN